MLTLSKTLSQKQMEHLTKYLGTPWPRQADVKLTIKVMVEGRRYLERGSGQLLRMVLQAYIIEYLTTEMK